MKLSDEEKREILEDARSEERKFAFRMAKKFRREIPFEEYLDWLQDVISISQSQRHTERHRNFFEYKNLKI